MGAIFINCRPRLFSTSRLWMPCPSNGHLHLFVLACSGALIREISVCVHFGTCRHGFSAPWVGCPCLFLTIRELMQRPCWKTGNCTNKHEVAGCKLRGGDGGRYTSSHGHLHFRVVQYASVVSHYYLLFNCLFATSTALEDKYYVFWWAVLAYLDNKICGHVLQWKIHGPIVHSYLQSHRTKRHFLYNDPRLLSKLALAGNVFVEKCKSERKKKAG